MNLNKHFIFVNIVNVRATFASESQPSNKVHTLTRAPNTTKIATSYFILFIHCNRLQLALVMSLWVDIHVGLMVVII
jgi:hypothetical protein